jgi:hypothetical protein
MENGGLGLGGWGRARQEGSHGPARFLLSSLGFVHVRLKGKAKVVRMRKLSPWLRMAYPYESGNYCNIIFQRACTCISSHTAQSPSTYASIYPPVGRDDSVLGHYILQIHASWDSLFVRSLLRYIFLYSCIEEPPTLRPYEYHSIYQIAMMMHQHHVTSLSREEAPSLIP